MPIHPESIETLRNLVKLHGARETLDALQTICEQEGIISRPALHTTASIIYLDTCECGKPKAPTQIVCLDCDITHYEYLMTTQGYPPETPETPEPTP